MKGVIDEKLWLIGGLILAAIAIVIFVIAGGWGLLQKFIISMLKSFLHVNA